MKFVGTNQTKIEQDLTQKLKNLEPQVLSLIKEIWDEEVTIQQLNARIGMNNNTFVDSVRDQFVSEKIYISRWLQGLKNKVAEKEEEQKKQYNGNVYKNTTLHFLIRCLQEEKTKEYIVTFLERCFFRRLREFSRPKPIDASWELWFGDNKLMWGIFVSPLFSLNEWRTDKSEIRKATYEYWTIGHLLEIGLINPDNNKTHNFSNADEVVEFYKNFLKRLSSSDYEKSIIDKYIRYLSNSENINAEPLLIPELRLTKEKKHEYRLDFVIFNPYTMKFTGFEISPSSSHMKIEKSKEKTQKTLNKELSEKWEKEMEKRNKYFSQFDITVVTFTDKSLKDLDQCFEKISKCISARNKKESTDFEKELLEIEQYQF